MGTALVVAVLLAAAPEDAATQQIREVLQRHGPDFAQCADATLDTTVRVDVRFMVGASGRVGEARLIQTSPPHPALGHCVVDVLRKLRFGRFAESETWVDHPFTFAPARPPAREVKRRFLAPAMARQIGWADLAPKVPYAMSGLCAKKVCVLADEAAAMCTQFTEGAKRLKAGAGYYDVVGPIAGAAHDLCCDDLVGALQAVENVDTLSDQQTIWFSGNWPRCDGFTDFWRGFHARPEGWVPTYRETDEPPRVSKPRDNEL